MKNSSKIKTILLILSILLFIISLTQKTYCVDNNCGEYGSGILCLALGWLGIGFGGAFISWLANPFLIISWIIPYKNQRLKIIFCSISTIFSLSFLFFEEVMKDEAGNYGKITGYELGYWLWTLSSLIFFLGNIYIYFERNKEGKSEQN